METIEEIKQEAITKLEKDNLDEKDNINYQIRKIIIEIIKNNEKTSIICGLMNSDYNFFIKFVDEIIDYISDNTELVKALNNIKEIVKLDEKNYEYFNTIYWEIFYGCDVWPNPKKSLKYDCGGYGFYDDEY